MHNALHYEESDSSDFENEIVTLNQLVRRKKIFHQRINYFEIYNEEEFLKRFRLKKQTVKTFAYLLANPTNTLSSVNEKLVQRDFIAMLMLLL